MVLCVTGPMAAGKNATSSILEKMGFVSIDADLIGHDAVEICKEKILEEFSSLAQKNKIQLLNPDGKINRKNLGQLLFKDEMLVKKQENIVFPYINSVLEKFIDENSKKNIVVNATVLYKVNAMKKIEKILFIDSPAIVRFFRAKKRDKMKSLLIIERFFSQRFLFSQNYRRSCRNGPCYRYTLLLTARHFCRQVIHTPAKAHSFKRIL